MAPRTNAKQSAALDPALPQKKRARRRVVGALAVCVAAAIVLPVVLDSEPRQVRDDVQVQIPSRDTPISEPLPGTARDADKGARGPEPKSEAPADAAERVEPAARADAGDRNEPLAQADQAGGASAPPRDEARPEPRADARPDAKAAPKADANAAPVAPLASAAPAAKADASPAPKTDAKTEPKPAPKTDAKTDAKIDAKTAPKADAKAQPKTDVKPAAKGDPKLAAKGDAKAGAKTPTFLLQIGAFASEKGATEQAQRARQAGLKAYTEKVQTPNGERIRVRVGPFASREAANDARGKLRAIGVDAALIGP